MNHEMIPMPPRMSPLEKGVVISTAAGAIAGAGFLGYLATKEQASLAFQDLPLPFGYLLNGVHTAYVLLAGAMVGGGAGAILGAFPVAVASMFRQDAGAGYRIPKP